MIRRRQPSRQMLKLLGALVAEPLVWRHGYDLMKDTGLSSGTLYPLPSTLYPLPSTLYPLLMQMTDQGLVKAEWREPAQPGRPARHAYRLTASGCALARSKATNGEVASGVSLG